MKGMYTFRWEDKAAMSFLRDPTGWPVAHVFCVGDGDWLLVFNGVRAEKTASTREIAKAMAEKGVTLLLDNMARTLAYFLKEQTDAGTESKR